VASYYACGRHANGTVECWGSSSVPSPPGSFQSISAGNFTACGVHTDGTLACWGSGYQLPPAISGTFTSVSVGDAHACAIRSDGAAVCWGDTTFDQSSGCTPDIGCIWVH